MGTLVNTNYNCDFYRDSILYKNVKSVFYRGRKMVKADIFLLCLIASQQIKQKYLCQLFCYLLISKLPSVKVTGAARQQIFNYNSMGNKKAMMTEFSLTKSEHWNQKWV
jgi:hypothetical protein